MSTFTKVDGNSVAFDRINVMECRVFSSRSVVDMVCSVTVVCRAFSPLRAFVLESGFAGIGFAWSRRALEVE